MDGSSLPLDLSQSASRAGQPANQKMLQDISTTQNVSADQKESREHPSREQSSPLDLTGSSPGSSSGASSNIKTLVSGEGEPAMRPLNEETIPLEKKTDSPNHDSHTIKNLGDIQAFGKGAHTSETKSDKNSQSNKEASQDSSNVSIGVPDLPKEQIQTVVEKKTCEEEDYGPSQCAMQVAGHGILHENKGTSGQSKIPPFVDKPDSAPVDCVSSTVDGNVRCKKECNEGNKTSEVPKDQDEKLDTADGNECIDVSKVKNEKNNRIEGNDSNELPKVQDKKNDVSEENECTEVPKDQDEKIGENHVSNKSTEVPKVQDAKDDEKETPLACMTGSAAPEEGKVTSLEKFSVSPSDMCENVVENSFPVVENSNENQIKKAEKEQAQTLVPKETGGERLPLEKPEVKQKTEEQTEQTKSDECKHNEKPSAPTLSFAGSFVVQPVEEKSVCHSEETAMETEEPMPSGDASKPDVSDDVLGAVERNEKAGRDGAEQDKDLVHAVSHEEVEESEKKEGDAQPEEDVNGDAKEAVADADAKEGSDEGSDECSTSKPKKRRSSTGSAPEQGEDETEVPHVTAEKLFEYQWPPERGGEWYMLQEQVSEFLGVLSFKRKHPDLQRRPVEMQEKIFLREKGVVTETQSDLGLTALKSEEVCELMMKDYGDRYQEYAEVLQERERKKMKESQKNYQMPKLEKSKMDFFMKKAIKSAAEYNSNFLREKREERRSYLDLQTQEVHFPQGKMKKLPPECTKVGTYPVALIPGQFQDYYKKYDPQQLKYFPINTALYDSPRAFKNIYADPNDATESEEEDGTNGSSSGDESGSSGSSSSDGDSDQESQKEPEVASKPQSQPQTPKNTPRRKKPVEAKVDLGKAVLAVCNVCNGTSEKNKLGEAEELVKCSECSKFGHPSCIELTSEMIPIIHTYPWQCMECKTCVECMDPYDEDKMMFCDHCDRGYHTFCVGLRSIPTGRWECPSCRPDQPPKKRSRTR